MQSFVAEIHRAAIMRLQDEETNGHGRISLRQKRMFAFEELVERNEIAKRLTHLLSVDGNHIVVHPVMNHILALRSRGLRNFTFVMRENKVHTATVNIKAFA